MTMKKSIPFLALALFVLLLASCKKNSSSSPAQTGKCKPLTEVTNFNNSNLTYTYSYSADGNLAAIKAPPANTVVTYSTTSTTSPATVRVGLTDSLNTYYNANIFTSLPSQARQWVTLDGVTYVDQWVFDFTYDAKSRLVKVNETTPHVTGDLEYLLTISYNDQDNVTTLKYEATTGISGVTVITATGYDDKPPYSAIKNWPLLMHAAWNNSDPAPLFEALSKNNPLGFTNSAITRTMVYTYNDNGFPIKRVNTNYNSSGSYSFDEIYTYQCE